MNKIDFTGITLYFFASYLHAASGDLDISFGPTKTGTVISELNRTARINDIQIDNNNNIIVVGSTLAQTEGSFVARYTSDGILDSSFNTSGIQEFYVGRSGTWEAASILPNADILVGGYIRTTQTYCALAKVTTSGAFDPKFNSSGEIITNLIGDGACIRSLAITTDGKYIAGGSCIKGLSNGMLLKYNSNGILDDSFGNNGVVLTTFGLQGSINKIGIQTDEKIVAVGYMEKGANTQFAVARYLPDGTPDPDFGSGGSVSTLIEYYATARALVFQPDGYIVVAGFSFDFETHVRKFVVARYDTQGNLDQNFNGTGIVITPIQYGAEAHAVIIQPDGKIIVGGSSEGNRTTQFTLVRYNNNGSKDESFGNNGIVTSSLGQYNSGITSMFLQNNTKLIAAGYADEDIALARYSIYI